MIQEAYVSFETAKLLKEKGFEGLCSTAYETITSKHNIEEVAISNWGKLNQIKRPTQQMAMAWLREVHHIAINIGWGEIFQDKYQWWCIVLNMDNGNILCEENYHASYEEAVETALKYTLENLI